MGVHRDERTKESLSDTVGRSVAVKVKGSGALGGEQNPLS